jgi:hypothetical protein
MEKEIKNIKKNLMRSSSSNKFNFDKCKICGKKAVTTIVIKGNRVHLCAKHYVKQEDEECLKWDLLRDIYDYNKINEPKEVQLEIKKQKPNLYESLKQYFEV